MTTFDKFSGFLFSLNVLFGFIFVGYFSYKLIGVWGLLITAIYIFIAVIGMKHALKPTQ